MSEPITAEPITATEAYSTEEYATEQIASHPALHVYQTDDVGYVPPDHEIAAHATASKFQLRGWQKVLLILLLVVALIGGTVGAIGFYSFSVVKQLQAQAGDVQKLQTEAYDQFKAQNLPGVEQKVTQIGQKVTEMRGTYSKLAFLQFVPVAGNYFKDGVHGFNAADAGISAGLKSIKAIEPYADVLGFKGQGSFTGGTTEDRLKVILQTLQKVTPQLDTIGGDLNTVKTEIGMIDATRYPETFMGHAIRSKILQAQQLSDGAATALTQFRPALEQLPNIAGATSGKKYFVLFQNDNELRPTGGFLTAFSIINVDNGKVSPEKSDDIYELDKKFKSKIPIPEVLGKYLTTEKYWNLRDMNTSPDFKVSMEQFLTHYKEVPDESHNIDGMIAVDTRVLTDLLRVLGPVDVPGYGKFSADNEPKCDCPQIIYALSEIADKPTNYIKVDRKGVLGPLMHELLTRAYSAPKVLWPQLFQIGWNNLQARHAQMYFFDAQAQAAAELIGAGGRLQADPNAKDFLAVVDANLGGAKSNLFITSDVKQEISAPAGGQITKKVTITYKNSRHGDNCNLEAGLLCLNATLRDWNRIYVPKGSKLISATGYRQGSAHQYDEGDFTVIEGEFTLDPLSQAKLEINYTVPYTDTKNYAIKMWKQAGIVSYTTLMDVNGNQEKVTVDKDVVYQAKF